ncbi:NUDIX domain-containing protein [Candidatus Saccharibacteria bacterium]|jgi:8-oxo-dGTP diphosphatase|nr:NUDIX domain-containing protein [Candidatus Saccharibacteria bacterium]
MGHIHTNTGQHDLTVSAFIFLIDDDNEPRMGFHMHKKLGMLMQFGGHVELHENPWQAMTHELLEESGYELSQLQILQPSQNEPIKSNAIVHPIPAHFETHSFDKFGLDHSHVDLGYAFVTRELPKSSPQSGESSDIRFLARQELLDLTDDIVLAGSRTIFLSLLDNCLPNWNPVSTQQFS